MVKKSPSKVIVALFLPASAVFLHAGGAKQHSAVASVNGVLIPKEYLTREVMRFEEQALSQGQLVDESDRDVINQQALDTLIDMELLYQESQRRGFEITEERIGEQVNDLRDQFADEEGFAELAVQLRSRAEIEEVIESSQGVRDDS